MLVAALSCLVLGVVTVFFGVVTVNGCLLRVCRSRSSQTIFAAGLQQSSSKRCECCLTSSLVFQLLINLFLHAAVSPNDEWGANGMCICSAQSLYLLWLLVSFSGHAFTGLLRRSARVLSYVMQPHSPPPRHAVCCPLSYGTLYSGHCNHLL